MFSIFLLSVFVVSQNQEGVSTETEQTRFVRIARIDGRAKLLRSGLKEWEDAAVNMMLVEGDRIYTEDDSYAELQFDNGTVVRLNERTDIEIVDLTREPESGDEITSVYAGTGNIKVNVPRYYRTGKAFNIETPHAMVTIEEESSVRVNTNNRTEVIVYNGRVDAVGEKGRVSLLGGERTLIEKGEGPAHPEAFKKLTADEFDKWGIEREDGERVSRKYLSDEIIVGVDELDCYGRWVFVHPYGWVWRPKVYFGWRPYFHGHWVFTRGCGWVWVSYEPWGWVPYHYGRWSYCWPYGWVWIPGPVWRPCWVVWCEDSYWVWWSPMGPCDGPWFHCSAHFGFGSRWVGVSKMAFKKYKYTHHPGKDYRKLKPYKYAGEPIKNMEWKKITPAIRPAYADNMDFADKKAIVPSHNNKERLPYKETAPTKQAITPESNRFRIPSASKKEILPQDHKAKSDSRVLPPDEYVPHKKGIVKDDTLVPSRQRRSEDEKQKRIFLPRQGPDESDYEHSPKHSNGKEMDTESHRINPGNPAHKSTLSPSHAKTERGGKVNYRGESSARPYIDQTPKNIIPSVSKKNYKK